MAAAVAGRALVLAALFGAARGRLLPAEMRLRRGGDQGKCPCSDPSLCKAVMRQPRREIFGFGADGNWNAFDWETITTICWATDPEIVCTAHAHGARVIAAAPDGMPLSGDPAVRGAYVNRTVALVKEQFLDGVTFDYEQPLARQDPRRGFYVDLVRETTAALHAAVPGSQVSVCVAWAPDDVDGRDYDYLGLAASSDLLYVMGYDTQSQIYDRCVASANSPASRLQRGVMRYLSMGVAREKLVLGVPWYGYDYPCNSTELRMAGETSPFCPIQPVPFRGASCSDAAGSEKSYFEILRLARGYNTTPRLWDATTQSPYFNFRSDEDGLVHQVWYDDAVSSAAKYAVAESLGIRGVGPYRFDQLDYVNEMFWPETAAMWDALRAYARGGSAVVV